MIPGAHVFTPFILLQKPLWGSVRGKAGTGARRQLRQKLGVNTEIGRRLLQVQADSVATFESLLFSAGNHANCAGKLLNSSASKKQGPSKAKTHVYRTRNRISSSSVGKVPVRTGQERNPGSKTHFHTYCFSHILVDLKWKCVKQRYSKRIVCLTSEYAASDVKGHSNTSNSQKTILI